jgi:Kef-type K+ transport system membrane component KefB
MNEIKEIRYISILALILCFLLPSIGIPIAFGSLYSIKTFKDRKKSQYFLPIFSILSGLGVWIGNRDSDILILLAILFVIIFAMVEFAARLKKVKNREAFKYISAGLSFGILSFILLINRM